MAHMLVDDEIREIKCASPYAGVEEGAVFARSYVAVNSRFQQD